MVTTHRKNEGGRTHQEPQAGPRHPRGAVDMGSRSLGLKGSRPALKGMRSGGPGGQHPVPWALGPKRLGGPYC